MAGSVARFYVVKRQLNLVGPNRPIKFPTEVARGIRLKKAGLITPEWAAPIVVRKASGAVKIYGDWPTARCLSKLISPTLFFKWKCKKNPPINTHRGFYRYDRLPLRVKAAFGAFQKLVDAMLGTSTMCWGSGRRRNIDEIFKMPFVGYILMLMASSSRRRSSRLASSKSNTRGTSSMNMVYDPIRPKLMRSIINMSAPMDISGLRPFLGAINYYG